MLGASLNKTFPSFLPVKLKFKQIYIYFVPSGWREWGREDNSAEDPAGQPVPGEGRPPRPPQSAHRLLQPAPRRPARHERKLRRALGVQVPRYVSCQSNCWHRGFQVRVWSLFGKIYVNRDYYQSVFGYRQYHVLGIKIVLCEPLA